MQTRAATATPAATCCWLAGVPLASTEPAARRDGQVTNRPVYTAIGVTIDGQRDILGLWIGTGGEGAKFRLQVLTEIKNAGPTTCASSSVTAPSGPPDAVAVTWPPAVVQTCVLHLIRNK
jgi:transposase-like protein